MVAAAGSDRRRIHPTPFYDSRKMKVYLCGLGHRINRKRIQRLMGKLGLVGMAPGPATSRPHPQHKVYPYLLRGG